MKNRKSLRQISNQRGVLSIEIAIRQIDGTMTLLQARERMRTLEHAYMNELRKLNN